jgi:hypothetical protein
MSHRRILMTLCCVVLLISGCRYKKGDLYSSSISGDSMSYVLNARGSGLKLANKTYRLKQMHERKGNNCLVIFLSDSAEFVKQKGFLLSNISLPNIKDDMLEKGFFGTLSSKQNVIYVLVTEEELKKDFKKIEPEKKKPF